MFHAARNCTKSTSCDAMDNITGHVANGQHKKILRSTKLNGAEGSNVSMSSSSKTPKELRIVLSDVVKFPHKEVEVKVETSDADVPHVKNPSPNLLVDTLRKNLFGTMGKQKSFTSSKSAVRLGKRDSFTSDDTRSGSEASSVLFNPKRIQNDKETTLKIRETEATDSESSSVRSKKMGSDKMMCNEYIRKKQEGVIDDKTSRLRKRRVSSSDTPSPTKSAKSKKLNVSPLLKVPDTNMLEYVRNLEEQNRKMRNTLKNQRRRNGKGRKKLKRKHSNGINSGSEWSVNQEPACDELMPKLKIIKDERRSVQRDSNSSIEDEIRKEPEKVPGLFSSMESLLSAPIPYGTETDRESFKEETDHLEHSDSPSSDYNKLESPPKDEERSSKFNKLIRSLKIRELSVVLNRDKCKDGLKFNSESSDEKSVDEKRPVHPRIKLKRSNESVPEYKVVKGKPSFKIEDLKIRKLTSHDPIFTGAKLEDGYKKIMPTDETLAVPKKIVAEDKTIASKQTLECDIDVPSPHVERSPPQLPKPHLNCSIQLKSLTNLPWLERIQSQTDKIGSKDTDSGSSSMKSQDLEFTSSSEESCAGDDCLSMQTSDLFSSTNSLDPILPVARRLEPNIETTRSAPFNDFADQNKRQENAKTIQNAGHYDVNANEQISPKNIKAYQKAPIDKALNASPSVPSTPKPVHVFKFPMATLNLKRPPKPHTVTSTYVSPSKLTEPTTNTQNSPMQPPAPMMPIKKVVAPKTFKEVPDMQITVLNASALTDPKNSGLLNRDCSEPDEQSALIKPPTSRDHSVAPNVIRNRPSVLARGQLQGTSNRSDVLVDDTISLFADTVLFEGALSDEEEPSKNSTSDSSNGAPLFGYFPSNEPSPEQSPKMENDYVASWLSTQNSIQGNDSDTTLLCTCPTLKKTGSCNNQHFCTYKHPADLKSCYENLPLEKLETEYLLAKLRKHFFLYKILFSLLAEQYGIEKDWNKLTAFVTDILTFDVGTDKTPFIKQILDCLCNTNLSPQSAVEMVFKKAELHKDLIDHLADMLLSIILKFYDLEESWTIFMILVKAKDYRVDSSLIEEILLICTRQTNPKPDLCRKAFNEIFTHLDKKLFKHTDRSLISVLGEYGLRDIASQLHSYIDCNNMDNFAMPFIPKVNFPPQLNVPPPINNFQIPPLMNRIIPPPVVPFPPYHMSPSPPNLMPAPPFNIPPLPIPTPVEPPFQLSNSKSLSPYLQSHSLCDVKKIREYIDTENIDEYIKLAQQCFEARLIDPFLKCSVEHCFSTNKCWSPFLMKLQDAYYEKNQDFMNIFEYTIVVKTLGINMVYSLVQTEKWQAAGNLLKFLRKYKQLAYTKTYGLGNYTLSRKLLIIFDVFIKIESFSMAWRFFTKEGLICTKFVRSKGTDDDVLYRNKLMDNFFRTLLNKRTKLVLVMVQYLLNGNKKDINFERFLDDVLVLAMNENYLPDFYKLVVKKMPNWNELIRHTTFRSVVAILIKDPSSVGLHSKLYKLGCKMAIYKTYTGIETCIDIRVDLLEEEIYLILQSFFQLKKQYMPILAPLLINVVPSLEIALNDNKVPKLFKLQTGNFQITAIKIMDILKNRLVPPISDIQPVSNTQLRIAANQLQSHLSSLTV